MSRYYSNGYTIEYPNELAYAGIPAIVRVSNATDYIGVGVTVKIGEEYYTETRITHNGSAVLDLSRYMQFAFKNKDLSIEYGRDQAYKNNLSQSITVVVQLTDSAGVSTTAVSFELKALYGYIAYGQSNGGARSRTLFANFPQTFDFYLTPDSDIEIAYDGGEATPIDYTNDVESIEQFSVELSRWWSVPSAARTAVLTAKESRYLVGDDLVGGDSVYRLTIDRCTSGVFLRWLDHFGQWCYYLLRRTGQTYATSEVQTWRNGVLRNRVAPERGVVQSDEYSVQQLEQSHTITLGAMLVDAETFNFLLGLTDSPRVEMLLNGEEYQDDNTVMPIWERVNIVAGSYARTNTPLQDFTVSIARTAQKSQLL